MAVSLTAKMNESKTIQVHWGDDVVDVSYHPNAVTPHLLDQVEEASKQDGLDMLGILLEPVLEWWDVLGADNERIPTDREHIATIPMPFLTKVQNAIQEDQDPKGSEASGGSAAG